MYVAVIRRFFQQRVVSKVFSCAALVIVADFLFYKQHLGWTLGLFALGVLLVSLLHQPHLTKTRFGNILGAAACGLGVALVQEPTLLAVCLYIATMVCLVLLPRLDSSDARHLMRVILRYMLLSGGVRLCRDSIVLAYVRKRLRKLSASPYGWVLHWLLPVFCSAIFVLLFAQANPIITGWLAQLDGSFFAEISYVRAGFWFVMASACWALLRPKLRLRVKGSAGPWQPKSRGGRTSFHALDLLFNERSILTSLLLFNALFFFQNAMDTAFLWSGAALPEGMTFARYAHRGAYPLMITALLAALFILIAFKAGVKPARNVRLLVYTWVGQNIFLVASSISRLLGYIEEYHLTYLRVNALIWMGLVAVGLMLIVMRIALGRTNRWLVNSNAIMLYATLYLCCFINFGGIIASYNVKQYLHSDMRRMLDLSYLQHTVGSAAIPGLIYLEQYAPKSPHIARICQVRQALQAEMVMDWRAWTYAKQRIAQMPSNPCGSDFPGLSLSSPTTYLPPSYQLEK